MKGAAQIKVKPKILMLTVKIYLVEKIKTELTTEMVKLF